MTFPLAPLQQPRIAAPPVQKTLISCCGYTCAQGIPKVWVCPACKKEHLPG